MFPPEHEVKETLRLVHQSIYDVMYGAWEDWLESTEFTRTRTSRTRANIVWDQMINRAFAIFEDDPRVKIIEHYGTVSFIFDGLVLLRFKKGDDNGHSMNYPTQTALAFHDHEGERQLNLFGPEDYYRVEATYVLDALRLEINNVLIGARDNSKKYGWQYEIYPDGTLAEEIPFPTPQETTAPRLLEPLIDAEEISKQDE